MHAHGQQALARWLVEPHPIEYHLVHATPLQMSACSDQHEARAGAQHMLQAVHALPERPPVEHGGSIGLYPSKHDEPWRQAWIPQHSQTQQALLHSGSLLLRIGHALIAMHSNVTRQDIKSFWGGYSINKEMGASTRKQCWDTRDPPVLPCYSTSILIDKGIPYLTSRLPHYNDMVSGAMFLGVLLDLLDTAATYGRDLPNVEFSVFVGDRPTHYTERVEGSIKPGPYTPVLSIAKRPEHATLLIPTGHYRCMSNDIDSMQTQVARGELGAAPWAERKPVAAGRWTLFCPYNKMGKPSKEHPHACSRQSVIEISKAHAELVDAAESTGKGHERYMSMADHSKYKYLLSLDGWSASSRFEKSLLLGSLVLKEHSPWLAFFYGAIKPGEHYVSFNASDPHQLPELVRRLRKDDARAARIAAAGRDFAVNHLNRRARMCYWRTLLKDLAEAFEYQPSCSQAPQCTPLAKVLLQLTPKVAAAGLCDAASQLTAMHV